MERRLERFTQAYSQAPWRKQLQFFGLFSLVLVFIALVAAIYLNVTARTAEVGRDIQAMQSRILQLDQENADLQAKLALLFSANTMQKRAEEMGFQPRQMDQTLFLVVPGYVERQPAVLGSATVGEVVPAPALPGEYTESMLTWLRRQLGDLDVSFLR